MAGYTSRILFTSLSSCVAVLTLIWYSRKKFHFRRRPTLEPASETISLQATEVNSDIISMNLKEQQQDDTLAHQPTPCPPEKTVSDKMHLKDKSQEPDFVDVKEECINGNVGKKQCNGNQQQQRRNGENGTTCDTKTNGVSTNGTSHQKYDNGDKADSAAVSSESNVSSPEHNNGDNVDCAAVSSESNVSSPEHNNGDNADSAAVSSESSPELNGCETVSTLTNGIDALCLDKEQDMSNIEVNNTSSVQKTNDEEISSKVSAKKTTHILNTSAKTFFYCKILPESPDSLPSLITNGNSSDLSCQTDFERKTLTPDSGVSAELQECGSSCSTLSEPSSESPTNGRDVLKSPSISESSIDCGKESPENDFNGEVAISKKANDVHFPIPSEEGPLHYDFEIPQSLCGYLIGRNGRNVKQFIERSNAAIMVNTHPVFHHMKVCTVSGTEEEIRHALDLIREKFPETKYPELTLDPINPLQTECTLPITIRLSLPEGVNFDVVLSSTVTPGHFFLQQPTHPTYHTLSWLSQTMTSWYTQYETPKVFRISFDNVVAVPMADGWYRAQVTDLMPETNECTVKFLDFGGYWTVPTQQLRQMRMEFSYVPFQAVECYLGNLSYPEDATEWSSEAKSVFEELAQGQILHGYIVGYEGDIPYVHLFRVQGASTVFINRELVNRGLARWTHIEEE